MKRIVRIKTSFEVVLDDGHEGIPYVHDPADLVFNGARKLPGLIEIKPGAKVAMSLDRESSAGLRRRDRVRRANSR